MHILFIFPFLICSHICAQPLLVHREEFENIRTEDGRDIKIQYFISQHCDIENNQHQSNKYSNKKHPAVPSVPATEEKSSWPSFSLKNIWGTLGISALGCAGYGLYYAFTKFNIFTLGKACLAGAGWSMWKGQNTNDLSDDSDQENDLLVDILNKYKTDRYTTAIAHFMQDVEQEEDLLNKYINQAESAQTSIFRFAFSDLSADIMHAKARISNLTELKKTVFGWLHKRSFDTSLRDIQDEIKIKISENA